MAKADAIKPSPTTLDPQDRTWRGFQLLGLGGVTLLIALSIIIYMGSHLGGCMYLDGSQ